VTKAVQLELRGDTWNLTRYAILDTPIFDKKISPELLAEHLKGVMAALGTNARAVTLSVGLDNAMVRQVDLPQIPISEMRLVLKNNTKAYLQQDLPGSVFDCPETLGGQAGRVREGGWRAEVKSPGGGRAADVGG